MFQRINDGSSEWRKVIGKGYEDWLTNTEFDLMIKLFQQRHILGHSDGYVDKKYLEKSGDNTFDIGQRIVVKRLEVVELLKIIKRIIGEIKKHCG